MANSTQSFKHHTRVLPPFHFFVVPVLLINLVIAIRHLVQVPDLATLWGVVFAAALFALGFVARIQPITVQDRVIRLEMRLRLRELLPPDLRSRVYELTPRQLVAMRFASDEELPELTREVLSGTLPTTKAIKMRVKNWQADLLRA
jgi:hypothetical protein